MKDARQLVEAACSQIGFGWRGSVRGDAVAQVRAQPGAGVARPLRSLRTIGGRVANGDDHSGRRALADELDRPGSLRARVIKTIRPPEGVLKLLKQAPVGIADRPGGVCAAVAVVLRDEWPFEVDAEQPARRRRDTARRPRRSFERRAAVIAPVR